LVICELLGDTWTTWWYMNYLVIRELLGDTWTTWWYVNYLVQWVMV